MEGVPHPSLELGYENSFPVYLQSRDMRGFYSREQGHDAGLGGFMLHFASSTFPNNRAS